MQGNLFPRWLSGDVEAFWQIWQHLWSEHYTWLVRFCTALADGNRATGEIRADQVWWQMLAELERAMRSGRLRWMGADQLNRYVRRLLTWRALDRARETRRQALAVLAPRPLDRRLIAARRFLDEISSGRMVTRDVLANPHLLETLRLKTTRQPALAAVITLALEYLHERLVAALPDDIEAGDMSWRELAASALPERLHVRRRDRSAFIIAVLGISRSAFDLRARRLRRLAGITLPRRSRRPVRAAGSDAATSSFRPAVDAVDIR